jgi:hypothetical protein
MLENEGKFESERYRARQGSMRRHGSVGKWRQVGCHGRGEGTEGPGDGG